eukprot:TRINITY_DN56681_c0_g1_i1.p1 TRINITY_DN56681_c0_g1~~TRINITY_DN56681_c0_g1_i1.p1  ORF type:complete len:334 (-),score=21.55 TRINITY_DN56681_c0_g1_i1:37-1038(-)
MFVFFAVLLPAVAGSCTVFGGPPIPGTVFVSKKDVEREAFNTNRSDPIILYITSHKLQSHTTSRNISLVFNRVAHQRRDQKICFAMLLVSASSAKTVDVLGPRTVPTVLVIPRTDTKISSLEEYHKASRIRAHPFAEPVIEAFLQEHVKTSGPHNWPQLVYGFGLVLIIYAANITYPPVESTGDTAWKVTCFSVVHFTSIHTALVRFGETRDKYSNWWQIHLRIWCTVDQSLVPLGAAWRSFSAPHLQLWRVRLNPGWIVLLLICGATVNFLCLILRAIIQWRMMLVVPGAWVLFLICKHFCRCLHSTPTPLAFFLLFLLLNSALTEPCNRPR